MVTMNLKNYITFLILVNITTWNLVSTQLNSDCITPDSNNGLCISIKQCPELLNLLKLRPLPPEIIQYLRQSTCGFDGRTPFVCCPTRIQSPPRPTQRPPLPLQETSVSDVSNHPRLKLLLPQICGILSEGDKITNGEEANLFEFPWMALLGYFFDGKISYRCGGSLINRRYVLTAAHCLVNHHQYKLIRVRLGEHNLITVRDCQDICAPPVQDFVIEEVIIHNLYEKSSKTSKHDIGLIRLSGSAIFNEAVNPICLPIGRDQQLRDLENKKAVVTGWGTTEKGTASPVLLKVSLPIIPVAECAKIYNASTTIDETQMCAGLADGKDSCQGDSGGPLQALSYKDGDSVYVQYGVVSFGPRMCGRPDLPGVYTRVGYYMQWILDVMKP